jgi:methionyl-tRNA formyltransferase
MKIAFAGSEGFSIKVLDHLLLNITNLVSLQFVITLSQRVKGRGKKPKNTDVYEFCNTKNIPVVTMEKNQQLNQDLRIKLKQIDILLVASFGIILDKNFLDLPKFGCINLHPSLLPEWRGAAPIQRAIEAGNGWTGVSIMKMVEKLDSGPIWKQSREKILKSDTTDILERRLVINGSNLLEEFFSKANSEKLFVPQDNYNATYAKKIEKKELNIDWTDSATCIMHKINAFYPKPCAYSFLNGIRVKFGRSKVVPLKRDSYNLPGKIIVNLSQTDFVVNISCGQGYLGVMNLQKEGGKWLSAKAFSNGFKLFENLSFNKE